MSGQAKRKGEVWEWCVLVGGMYVHTHVTPRRQRNFPFPSLPRKSEMKKHLSPPQPWTPTHQPQPPPLFHFAPDTSSPQLRHLRVGRRGVRGGLRRRSLSLSHRLIRRSPLVLLGGDGGGDGCLEAGTPNPIFPPLFQKAPSLNRCKNISSISHNSSTKRAYTSVKPHMRRKHRSVCDDV